MRYHKFIVLIGSADYAADVLDGTQYESVIEQIYGWDDMTMHFVTCHHEKFEDNLVTYKVKKTYTDYETKEPKTYEDEVSLLRDVDGKLWCWEDYLSKAKIIENME